MTAVSTKPVANPDQPLTARESKFAFAYTNAGADTYHSCVRSAHAAGYSDKTAKHASGQLRRKANIAQRIAQLDRHNKAQDQAQFDAQTQSDQQYTVAELKRLKAKYEASGNATQAVRCLEGLAKACGLNQQALSISLPERHQIDEHQRQELLRLTRLCIADSIATKGLQQLSAQSGNDLATQGPVDGHADTDRGSQPILASVDPIQEGQQDAQADHVPPLPGTA
jgi:hypothetical protein